MQPVNMGQLVESLQHNPTHQSQNVRNGWQPSTARIEQAVNYFFEKLEGFSPGRFKNMYGDIKRLNMVKAEWSPLIGRLTKADIDAGFNKAKIKAAENDARYQWPDVSTFVGLCRVEPADLGLPEAEEAYREACHKSHNPSGHKWSHAAVREAAKLTGWYELQGHSENHQKTKELFLYNYGVLVDRALKGEDLNRKVVTAISDQSKESPVDVAIRDSEERLRATMEEIGINPEGGRSEFLKYLKTL